MAHPDIAIIHISNFHHIKALNLAAEIWTSLKAGKIKKVISLYTITTNLGTATCKAVVLFYVFTGSDSTSFMFKASDPAAHWCTVQFATIVDTPFQASTRLKELAASLSVGCTKTNLTKPMMFDLVRMRLFSQTTRDLERIHQLRIHLINISKGVSSKRVSGQEPTCLCLLPIWTTLPLAKDVFHLYVKCTCPITCSQFKCMKTKLKCTHQCKCTCEK